MLRLYLTISALGVVLAMQAQSGATGNESAKTDASNDSIVVHRLEEFVVQGKQIEITNIGVLIHPSEREKKYANDAFSLVRNLNVSFLDAKDDEIVSRLGGDLKIFINYESATTDDLKGLRPKDVLSVEYLEAPSDARFMGANYVLNFIVKELEYGGYLRLAGNQTIGYNSDSYSLYNKLKYKKVTFDLSANTMNKHDRQEDVMGTNYMGLSTPAGDTYDLQKLEDYKYKTRQSWNDIALRALYGNSSFSTSNILRYSFYKAKTPRSHAVVDYITTPLNIDLPDFSDSESVTYNSNRSNLITYTGRFFFKFNDKNVLVLNPSFSHRHYDNMSNYTVGVQDPIINNWIQNSNDGSLDLTYGYTFNPNNYLEFTTSNSYSHSVTDYSGSIDGLSNQGYSSYYSRTTLMFKHNFSGKLFMKLCLGLTLNRISNNAVKQTPCNPYAYYQIGYNPNSKIRFGGSLFYITNAPGVGESADLLSQVNEVEWVKGNPYLRDDKYIFSNISAFWTPSQQFNMSARITFTDNKDMAAPYWTPQGEIMLKQYLPDGEMKIYSAEVSPSINLFNYRLRILPELTYHHDVISGQQKNTYNYWTANFNVSYQVAGFSFSGYIYSPLRMLGLDQVRRFPMQYGLSIDYFHKNWSVGITGRHFFRTRGYNKYWEDTPTYNFYEMNYTKSYGRHLSIRLSYTFDYGKTVDRSSELYDSGSKSASVLR